MHLLGWKLSQIGNEIHEYEHKAERLDEYEMEMNELNCSQYPLSTDPEIDVDDIRIDNEDFRDFIRDQLRRYNECVAQHEMASGTIKGHEFPISLLKDRINIRMDLYQKNIR